MRGGEMYAVGCYSAVSSTTWLSVELQLKTLRPTFIR